MAETTEKKMNGTFEKNLFKAADKLRKNMDAAEYKHIVLGLIFLKYISDSFEDLHSKLLAGKGDYEGSDPEDADEYRGENVFWVHKKARWGYLHSRAKLPSIGKDVDEAMEEIEKENPTLKGILPKVYARPNLDKASLGGLIDLIGNIALGDEAAKSKDILGRVYEYFLGEFALAEGRKGGQFYTPKSIVQLLVNMIEPFKGRVFDPCCGSGGMFVMSEKFVKEHRGRLDDIAIYGQESNQTTYRLCRMNLALRGIDGSQVIWNNEGSFLKDLHSDLKADYILANPPFNDSDWSGELLQKDGRWQFGVPPAGNANYAWLQHFIYHLSPNGIAGIVLAKGSLSSDSNNEGDIRKNLVEEGLVDCIVSLPDKLFFNTSIPACLWIISRRKNKPKETLFIDARKFGGLVTRRNRGFEESDIQDISNIYHNWKKGKGYSDVDGLCKSVNLKEIQDQRYVLLPSRYIGTPDDELDDESYESIMPGLSKNISTYSRKCQMVDEAINQNFKRLNILSDINFAYINSTSLERIMWLLFKSWVVDFNFPDLSSLGYSHKVTQLKDTEFGEIPEDWDVKALDEIANFLNGLALQKYPPESQIEYLPVIKIRELKQGITEKSDKASHKIKREYVVTNGDVLFSWSGSLELSIWCKGTGALNQHLFKVTSVDYPKWFYYFWTKYYLPEFRRTAADKATTMGHIQRHHLKEAIVIVPHNDLMKVMDKVFSPMVDKYILLETNK